MNMLKTRHFIALLTVCAALTAGARSGSAELLYNGRAQSLLYSYEDIHSSALRGDDDSEDSYRFFQYLRLNLVDRRESRIIGFHTYMRVTDDLNIDYERDPHWRLYNGYLKIDTRRVELDLGRQWLHLGPGSMTLDGGKVSIKAPKSTVVTGYFGLESPYSRGFNTHGWEKAGSGGFHVRTGAVRNLRLGAGWYQKNRHGEVAFREVGFDAVAKLPAGFDLTGRLDVNMLTDELQRSILRLRYTGSDKVNFFFEQKHFTPRLFYKSYFQQKFELASNEQMRTGLTYFLRSGYYLNASYAAVFFDEDQAYGDSETSGYLSLSAGCPYGSVTYYKGHGFGGDEDGFAVSGSLPLADDRLELFADIDYSKYRFYDYDDRDYLFSSIFGFHWRPQRNIVAGMEFEDVNNDVLSKDFRVQFKFAYNFSSAF